MPCRWFNCTVFRNKVIMLNEKNPDTHYLQFVQNVVRDGMVYALQDQNDSFAECPSEEWFDQWGNPLLVLCFWDDADDALVCQQDEWSEYQLAEYSLDELMIEILPAMHEQEELVGIAFDSQLYGSEADPLELLADLISEIEHQNLHDEYDLKPLKKIVQDAQQENRVIH